MIPRGTLDIGWSDLANAIIAGCLKTGRAGAQQRTEAVWDSPQHTLACLSVRSGFDLFLQAAAWPTGTEVLVSAVTIPDMVRVLKHHRLVPVPLDVSPDSLSIDVRQLVAACTPLTRALLVAHLFGARLKLDAVVAAAHANGLRVVEDCAQVYDGAYRGHPEADVRMFSFGPIKTATALGGAILHMNDSALACRMRNIQDRYPGQRRGQFLKRALQAVVLKLLGRPAALGVFARACKWAGTDHDTIIVRALRGFRGDNLIEQIRRAPGAPLCHLLERRLRAPVAQRIERRRRLARSIIDGLACCSSPGSLVEEHSHWVLPISSRDPAGLIQFLWRRGFDATRSGSSLEVVDAPAGRRSMKPVTSQEMLESLVYLPMYPDQSAMDVQRLVLAVREFEEAAGELGVRQTRSAAR